MLCYSIFSHLCNLRPIKSTEFLCMCSLPKARSRQVFLFLLHFSKKVDYKCLTELKSRHLAVLTRLRTRLASTKKVVKDSDYTARKRGSSLNPCSLMLTQRSRKAAHTARYSTSCLMAQGTHHLYLSSLKEAASWWRTMPHPACQMINCDSSSSSECS